MSNNKAKVHRQAMLLPTAGASGGASGSPQNSRHEDSSSTESDSVAASATDGKNIDYAAYVYAQGFSKFDMIFMLANISANGLPGTSQANALNGNGPSTRTVHQP